MPKYIYHSKIEFERKPLVTEEQLIEQLDRTANVYQGPLRDDPEVDVPLWAVVSLFVLFIAGVGFLVWVLQ